MIYSYGQNISRFQFQSASFISKTAPSYYVKQHGHGIGRGLVANHGQGSSLAFCLSAQNKT